MQPRLILAALACAATLGAQAAPAQTLRGSRASVELMYREALSHSLPFYRNPNGVRAAANDGDLVRLSGNADYRVSGVTYPYALSITRTFVQRLAAQYRDACGEKLVVTSAMRPRSFRLFNSVDKSVHPSGMAVDFRKPANARCRNWLRQRLLHLEGERVLEATEEHRPPHFHVAVFPGPYRRYIAGSDAPARRASATKTERRPAAKTERRTTTKTERRPAARAERRTHRVRQGESLWTIARRNGVTVERLRDANGLRGRHVQPGQVLTIPSAR
jgi:hypothetical protein